MQLTVSEVARFLNVSEKTIYRWVRKERIPHYRINDQYRFNRVEILDWATAKRLSLSDEILAEPESHGVPLPTLSEALSAGGIHYRISGTDRDSVLRSIVEVLRLPDDVNRDFLFRVLRAREDLGSTAIGNGIAIPHVRNPIVLHLKMPTITACFLESPIDFGALDHAPVFLLFTLISPTMRAHLHLLSRLSFALRDRTLLDVLRTHSVREAILGRILDLEASMTSPPDGQPTSAPRPSTGSARGADPARPGPRGSSRVGERRGGRGGR